MSETTVRLQGVDVASVSRIHHGVHDTDLGPLHVGVAEGAVVWAAFVDDGQPDETGLREHWPHAELELDVPGTAHAAARVRAGTSGAEPVDVRVHGTPFHVQVWQLLVRIDEGDTLTYGELAAELGRPVGASRAIGQAVASNAVAVLVPCHRVVQADGGLGSYRWGVSRKRLLVSGERGQGALL